MKALNLFDLTCMCLYNQDHMGFRLQILRSQWLQQLIVILSAHLSSPEEQGICGTRRR